MAYHTLDNLKAVIPEEIIISLTDDGDVGKVGEEVLAPAIAATDSLIDSYVSAQYSVPLASVPAEIVDIACDITAYKLYKRRQEELSDTRLKAYREAIRLLEQIRDGKHPLNIAAPSSGGFSSGVVVSDAFWGGYRA